MRTSDDVCDATNVKMVHVKMAYHNLVIEFLN